MHSPWLAVRRWFSRAAETVKNVRLMPPRERYNSPDAVLGISAVFRAVQVLTTATEQLSLDAYRGGRPLEVQPSLMRKPSTGITRSQWLAEAATSLALNGNLFLRKTKGADGYSVIDLEILPPALVAVYRHPKTNRLTYAYDGKEYGTGDIEHVKFLAIPGRLRGLGPIDAAAIELRGHLDLRDYSAGWYQNNTQPPGVLSTDQVLTGDMAEQYKKRWVETDDGGIRVIGQGLTYRPLMLTPEAAQFVEVRKMSVTDVGRLLGIPASLMLAAIDGSSDTYSNVEQEWISFTRFTLMAYLRPIEEALSDILPNGQTARFNLDALLRTDTKTRYEAYEIGLRAGFLTVDEVRSTENLPALPATQPKEITTA